MKTEINLVLRVCQLSTLIISMGTLAACCAFAGPHEGGGAPPQPPTQAIDACKFLSSGQECSFTFPHKTVQGTCWAPEGKPLACKPKDAPSTHPNAPKQ